MKAYDIKKGNVVEHNGTVYQVRDIERSSPQGRGGNVKFRFTMYSVPGGTKFDLSLRRRGRTQGSRTQRAARPPTRTRTATRSCSSTTRTTRRTRSTPTWSAMPPATSSTTSTGCYVQIIDDMPVALQLPQSVVMEVVETPPELKGGTATKRPKPAKLSTGIEIQVPEYIGNGEKVWVNTTTGEFGGRADYCSAHRSSGTRHPLSRHPSQRRIRRFIIDQCLRSRAMRGRATRR